MCMSLRDKGRYGKFKANSNIGEIIISISIWGWGERIIINQNNEEICDVKIEDFEIDEEAYGETDDEINAIYFEETDEKIRIGEFDNNHTLVEVEKPFIRTLKRYK